MVLQLVHFFLVHHLYVLFYLFSFLKNLQTCLVLLNLQLFSNIQIFHDCSDVAQNDPVYQGLFLHFLRYDLLDLVVNYLLFQFLNLVVCYIMNLIEYMALDEKVNSFLKQEFETFLKLVFFYQYLLVYKVEIVIKQLVNVYYDYYQIYHNYFIQFQIQYELALYSYCIYYLVFLMVFLQHNHYIFFDLQELENIYLDLQFAVLFFIIFMVL